METIRKIICLEDARSRRQGLFPYIPYNTSVDSTNPFIMPTDNDFDGNYGGFVANLSGVTDLITSSRTYCDAIRIYNIENDLILNGKLLKKLVKNGDTYYISDSLDDSGKLITDYEACPSEWFSKVNNDRYAPNASTSAYIHSDYINMVDSIVVMNSISGSERMTYSAYTEIREKVIGEIPVTCKNRGYKTPRYINLCDIKAEYEWMTNNRNTTDCCIKKEWESKGGESYINFLMDHISDYVTALNKVKKRFVVTDPNDIIPSINISIMLTCDISNLGMLHADENVLFEVESASTYSYESGITGTYMESKLKTLMIDKKFYDDDGNLLPGVLTMSPTYYEYKNKSWKECGSIYTGACESYTIKEALPDVEVPDTIVLVRYSSSNDTKLSIPYNIHEPKNIVEVTDDNGNQITDIRIIRKGRRFLRITVYRFQGDYIDSIDESVDGEITFTYVIGGEYWAVKNTDDNTIGTSRGGKSTTMESNNFSYEFYERIDETGIVCKEVYPYYKDQTLSGLTINGKSGITIYYNKIDYDSIKITFNHSYIKNVSRLGNITNIIAQPKGGYVLNEVINTPLYKKDYLMGICDISKFSDEIIVNRGNASSNEKHYKLSECNTFEDLENMTNNFFNL